MQNDDEATGGTTTEEAAAALVSYAKKKQLAVTFDFNAVVLTVTPTSDVASVLSDLSSGMDRVRAEAERSEDEPKRYYIQNCRAGYVGNSVVFWAHDSGGYTCNADEAGVYTEEEARKICGNRPEVDRMLLKSAVDKHWRRNLDAQDLGRVLGEA